MQLTLEESLIENGSIEAGDDVITPFTDEKGESKEFYENYARYN